MIALSAILSEVDWARMPAPQADLYDTRMTLRLAASGSPLRDVPYRRRPSEGYPTVCEGRVTVRPPPDGGLLRDDVIAAPLDHRNLPRSAALLARWPEVYAQFKELIDTIFPYSDPDQARQGRYSCGSSSHSYENDFGSVHVTVDDAYGLAQALVHEMAHHKLRALGVSLESATRLIVNRSDELFKSPIIQHRLRPMTAVFHAQYSFMYVTALDLAMLRSAASDWERTRIVMLLARNAPRMEAGYEEISRFVETDEEGARFVAAFMRWSEDVLSRARMELDEHGYGRV